MEFLDGGKRKKHFPVLFSGNMAQLMNFMGLLIFPIKWGGGGGGVGHHPRLEKPKFEVVTLGNLYVYKHATCDFQISTPVTVPHWELCDNDNKQSNYRLMIVLFCTRALFPDFSKSSK